MDSLQFQKAEFEDPRPKCAACRNPVEGSYFDLAGRTVCTRCAEVLRDRQTRPPAIRRGLLYGMGAAVVCAIVYSIVTLATDRWLPLLSIAVGYIVGRAVRVGSGGLGGRRCQIVAVALAYFAITMSYASILVKMSGSRPLGTAGVAEIAAFSLAAPFREVAGGFGGILVFIIVLVGLAQAWRLTARGPRVLTGPHALAGRTVV